MEKQPGDYSPYASQDCRLGLQHIALSGKALYVFFAVHNLVMLMWAGDSQEAS